MSPAATAKPIYLRHGSVIEKAVDVSVTGPTFSWSQDRSYYSGGSGSTQLGGKWFSNNGDMKINEGVVQEQRLIFSGFSKRVFEYDEEGYIAPNDSPYTLVKEESGKFTLTDTVSGEVLVFSTLVNAHNLLEERTTLAWQAAGKDGTLYTYDENDHLTQITSPEGQDYNIVFTYTGDEITKIEVRTGAGTSTRVQEVEYTYFDGVNHSSDLGADGDLVQVKTAKLKTGGNVATAADWLVRYTQYRYDSDGLLKAVFEADAVRRTIDDRSDVTDADDILALDDDDDNSGSEDHEISEYASRRFTYYTVDVKTDNTGAGTGEDPKCVTVWDANGENLQTKYGGTNLNETNDYGDIFPIYRVKTEEVGECSSCGGSGSGLKREYFYLKITTHSIRDDNEAAYLVVEDTIDADGNGLYRTVFALNDAGNKLREVRVTDPDGTPAFWCQSWKMVDDTGAKQHRLEEYRTPAAHNVTSTTVDEFLDPSHNGDYTNDTNTLNNSAGPIHVWEYNAAGFASALRIKKGRTGSAYYVWAKDYLSTTNDRRNHLVTYSYEYPTATTSRTDASRIQTQHAYTFWSGTDDVKTATLTLPSIAAGQNGSGSSATMVVYYDSVGRLRWNKDALGYVAYYSYHPENGQLAYTVNDADPTALPTSADANSTKWVTSSDASASSNKPTRGGGLPTEIEQVARAEFDSQGRQTLAAAEDGTDGTILDKHFAVYETNRTLQFPYWDLVNTNKSLVPIRVTAFDDGGTVTERYTVDPARTAATSGVPTGLSSGTDQTHYLTWTRLERDDLSGKPIKTHVYHDIPSSGNGTKNTNYAERLRGYNAAGLADRSEAPGGTITRTVFDAIDRVDSTWIGTDDTPTSGDWSPTNNTGANMTKVVEYEYDGDSAGGNGNRTKQITYLTDAVEANARVTLYKYDWRDRRIFFVDAEEYSSKVTYDRLDLDHMGRTTKIERYYDADDDANFPDDGTVDAGDRLLGRTEALQDDLGRVYRTKNYSVDPDDGTVGSCLVADTWRDAAGQTIKQQKAGSEQFTKTTFDGLGRITKRYTGYDTDETAYGDADDVTGDTILDQLEITYDSGNATQTTAYARKHTASGTGALTTTTARAGYTTAWYDGADRQTASANYGTNGGSAFTRPGTAPSRSDTVLVTSTEYNTAGLAYKITDPAAREDRLEFDDAGRQTKTIQNYTDGNPSTGTSDEDVTVENAYNSNGTLSTLTAKNPTTGDQATTYVYGTDTGGITPYVYRNDLLRADIYPDSDDTTALGNGTDGVYDRVELKYNIQGNLIEKKDQLATVHTYEYDDNGRRTHDRVTTVGTGVDNAVLRVSTTYDIRGLVDKLTSYDNATVGSGSVVNEIVSEYDDLGLLSKEYQEHEGAKDANTLYVGYNRDTTVASGEYTKGLRLKSVRYPNARLVHTTYSTSGTTPDATNRLDAIKDDNSGSPGNSFADYSYLGLGRIVIEDFTEPDVKLNFDSGTAGEYAGFDRFGRVVDQLWYDYGATANRDQYTYGYDRASNRTWRENTVGSGFDEVYEYDEVDRLDLMDRGIIDSQTHELTSLGFSQDWDLDATGNWASFREDDIMGMPWDLDQDRTQNKVNEITNITETTGTAWITPVQDKNGNMTTVPKPSSLANGLTCEYDAWNRLVEVKDGATVVAKYEYDGLNRRIKKHLDSQSPADPDGLDTYVHYFYNSSWQILETRQTTTESDQPESLQPKYQNVWSPRYIDAPILRDENTDQDSLCDDQRLYYLTDANHNVTTLTDTAGDAVEHYLYDPYGKVTIYDGGWSSTRSTSSYNNVVLYTGRELDPESGIMHYRNRYYHTALGRFLSRDQIAYGSGDRNLYRYVVNGPTNATDPSGNSPWFWIGIACFAGLVALGAYLMCCGWDLNQIRGETDERVDDILSGWPPGYSTDGEGTPYDALQHCIGACEANQNPGSCGSSAIVRCLINNNEDDDTNEGKSDLKNNKAGYGITGDCKAGCLALLNAGKLSCFSTTGLFSCPPLP